MYGYKRPFELTTVTPRSVAPYFDKKEEDQVITTASKIQVVPINYSSKKHSSTESETKQDASVQQSLNSDYINDEHSEEEEEEEEME